MKLLHKAASIIERDALQARLRDAGIESESPARDTSRKVTDATVDLSMGGYSAMFDGFSVLVNESDEAAAQQVLAEFLESTRLEEAPQETRHWNRFYFTAVFSIPFPFLMSLAATYHLIRAVESREKPALGKLIFALLCFAAGWGFTAALIIGYLDGRPASHH
jgi:hypothetical protein